eukprot:tig00000681_g3059.t1
MPSHAHGGRRPATARRSDADEATSGRGSSAHRTDDLAIPSSGSPRRPGPPRRAPPRPPRPPRPAPARALGARALTAAPRRRSKESTKKLRWAVVEFVVVNFQFLVFPFKLFTWPGMDLAGEFRRLLQIFVPLRPAALDFRFYLALFWGAFSLVGISVAAALYVGWAFANQAFRIMWPMKFLRFVVSNCVGILYMPLVSVFSSTFNCPLPGSSSMAHLYFPERLTCWTGEHITLFIAGLCAAVVFTAFALLAQLLFFEPDFFRLGPNGEREYFSRPNARVDALFFLNNVALSVLVNLDALPRDLVALVFLACGALLLWLLLAFYPYHRLAVNMNLTGVVAAFVYMSFLCLLDARSGEPLLGLSIAMLAGFVPAYGAGALASWARYRLKMCTGRVEDISRLKRPVHVEIATRFVYTAPAGDQRSVETADAMFQLGLEKFPGSAGLLVSYATFCFALKGSSVLGFEKLRQAAKMAPGFDLRFTIYKRELERQQAANAVDLGDAAKDLATLARIDSAERRARLHYGALLSRYPRVPRILRAYARFQAEVLNDEATAQKLFEQADECEDERERKAHYFAGAVPDPLAGLPVPAYTARAGAAGAVGPDGQLELTWSMFGVPGAPADPADSASGAARTFRAAAASVAAVTNFISRGIRRAVAPGGAGAGSRYEEAGRTSRNSSIGDVELAARGPGADRDRGDEAAARLAATIQRLQAGPIPGAAPPPGPSVSKRRAGGASSLRVSLSEPSASVHALSPAGPHGSAPTAAARAEAEAEVVDLEAAEAPRAPRPPSRQAWGWALEVPPFEGPKADAGAGASAGAVRPFSDDGDGDGDEGAGVPAPSSPKRPEGPRRPSLVLPAPDAELQLSDEEQEEGDEEGEDEKKGKKGEDEGGGGRKRPTFFDMHPAPGPAPGPASEGDAEAPAAGPSSGGGGGGKKLKAAATSKEAEEAAGAPGSSARRRGSAASANDDFAKARAPAAIPLLKKIESAAGVGGRLGLEPRHPRRPRRPGPQPGPPSRDYYSLIASVVSGTLSAPSSGALPRAAPPLPLPSRVGSGPTSPFRSHAGSDVEDGEPARKRNLRRWARVKRAVGRARGAGAHGHAASIARMKWVVGGVLFAVAALAVAAYATVASLVAAYNEQLDRVGDSGSRRASAALLALHAQSLALAGSQAWDPSGTLEAAARAGLLAAAEELEQRHVGLYRAGARVPEAGPRPAPARPPRLARPARPPAPPQGPPRGPNRSAAQDSANAIRTEQLVDEAGTPGQVAMPLFTAGLALVSAARRFAESPADIAAARAASRPVADLYFVEENGPRVLHDAFGDASSALQGGAQVRGRRGRGEAGDVR